MLTTPLDGASVGGGKMNTAEPQCQLSAELTVAINKVAV